ncbi:MAG: HAD-IC family P-type ATPase [Oscillospiraceae bacterium]|jgi:cation-transporting ATPase E|nr:HAD-IC family P-type ATPase [Oscillospiraceae bacterium]
MTEKIKRFDANIKIGLTSSQVEERVKQGLNNADKTAPTKTILQIIQGNTFTLFNLINTVLALALVYVGSYKNLMFMGVMICNSIIGTIQEIRSKIAVDKLNLISRHTIEVIRNGEKIKIPKEDLVLDDIIHICPGDQIAADCIVLQGTCGVNESLLTGEPNLITKNESDILLSGSIMVSGIDCIAKIEKVGSENYASKILSKAKYIKKTKSEIMETVNKIVKFISIVIIPIGCILFYRQLKIYNYNIEPIVVSVSAALISMIPEGLVLLISTVLAVGIIRLSKHKVLVQDLYCIETLAGVDTMFLDKTGTITEGTFEVEDLILQNNFSDKEAKNALNLLSGALNDRNETFKAIKETFYTNKNLIPSKKIIPFSSEKKWSGARFENNKTYILGAAEFTLSSKDLLKMQKEIKMYSENYRVLVLSASENDFKNNDNLPDELFPMALILIKDKIRKNAKDTLKYFADQGVDIKIISGDSPLTVYKIANSVNLKNSSLYIDCSTLKTEEDISKAAKKYTIFGRVTPMQKQQIIKFLKNSGHTVAMVGDGVNDVLALKEADCSIAMAQGCQAARSISHIVLLNSDFSAMPKVLLEGRRTINNIQKSSSVFLTKTLYSVFLAVLFVFISIPYPFIPVQMTLISALTIGIPSFVLALQPNENKVSGNLLKNIFSKSLPTAITIFLSIIMCIFCYKTFGLSKNVYSGICVMLTGFIEILFIYKLCIPLNKLRKILLYFISVSFVGLYFIMHKFFSMEITVFSTFLTIILGFVSVFIYRIFDEYKFKDEAPGQ